jgi:hypothetical protein
MAKKLKIQEADIVEILDDSCKKYPVREIGEKNFHNDGGGIRLQGITLYSDFTGYEKCFKRDRFKLVKK